MNMNTHMGLYANIKTCAIFMLTVSMLGDRPWNMFSVAAAGAGSRASITSVVPLGALMTMKWPPPRPEAAGLRMPWQSAVVIAASTALPPCLKIVTPVQNTSAHGGAVTLRFG